MLGKVQHFIYIYIYIYNKTYVFRFTYRDGLMVLSIYKKFQKMMVKIVVSSFDGYNLVLFMMNSGTSYTKVLI